MVAKIISTGSYLPKKVLTNKDLEKMVDTSDEWIITRTGISKRHIADKDEFTSDMGYQAAKNALKKIDMDPKDIDLILVATLTPDYIFPSTACLIQAKLKSKNAAALDIQAACSGYLYGLQLAKALVEQKIYKNVLIIASEKLSSIVNYEDRQTCVLFGDGASSCIISLEGDGFEIKGINLGADGEQANLLILPAGGSKNPATLETVKDKKHFIHMEGREVFKYAVRMMEKAAKDCLESLNMKEEEVSWLIPHQANMRIISAIAKRFPSLSEDRVYKDVVAQCGNTSASSVGIALNKLIEEDKIKSGENVMLAVFGAGFTWGAAVIKK